MVHGNTLTTSLRHSLRVLSLRKHSPEDFTSVKLASSSQLILQAQLTRITNSHVKIATALIKSLSDSQTSLWDFTSLHCLQGSQQSICQGPTEQTTILSTLDDCSQSSEVLPHPPPNNTVRSVTVPHHPGTNLCPSQD